MWSMYEVTMITTCDVLRRKGDECSTTSEDTFLEVDNKEKTVG